MKSIFALLISIVFACTDAAARSAVREHPGEREFLRELVAAAQAENIALDQDAVRHTLDRARYQQSIIDAISRPAEAKPWKDYRPIFMTPTRIADGVAFYRDNRELLDRTAQQYGVPAELVVAIIGVETNYGRITGKYKVIDALVTLGFYYEPRRAFFRAELQRLFLLPGEQFPFALDELTGSYAGAMGWGQFMPSSWARFAQDADGDGQIDLWNSKPDIFASIANYFVGHGWVSEAPVAHPASGAPSARPLTPSGYEPVYSVGQLAEWGYHAEPQLDPHLPATLIKLDGVQGPEFWLTHQNFFVITRYNRSPLYAMAVYQLAQAIAEGARADATARR
jgi:membrane-bound lytic murein transglycosylase B